MTQSALARVLLLADTHLGFDLPLRPKIERRRRGHDFEANFRRALQPALEGAVDMVVHGGDLLYRSRVPAALVEMAMTPLVQVAEQGVPVFLVPGNHERSRIPLHLWTAHPMIHIFDRPRTFVLQLRGGSIALSGFPFARKIGGSFPNLVHQTGYLEADADARLLCMHQTVEGARVGVQDYVFRSGPDVIAGNDIPGGFSAVLAGHIHRAQVLRNDLRGRQLAAPVIYPGSIERTSFAERDEEKGYMLLKAEMTGRDGGRLADVSFVSLPARPMFSLSIELGKMGEPSLSAYLAQRLAVLPPDSVVRVQVEGPGAAEAVQDLSAAHLRSLAPVSMNVSLGFRNPKSLA